MSASRKADPLSKFSRGERRNAARQVAKETKKPFREVWERAYRWDIVLPQPSVLSTMASAALRFVIRHIVTPSGRVLHPTKGWRGKDGLPLGRRAVS